MCAFAVIKHPEEARKNEGGREDIEWLFKNAAMVSMLSLLGVIPSITPWLHQLSFTVKNTLYNNIKLGRCGEFIAVPFHSSLYCY